MKKVVVTGHTSGLGLYIYNHFINKKDYNVIGLSRSNGFDIDNDIDKVINFIKDEKPDYFFNNVHCRTTQSAFIEQLAPETIVITSGSMAADLRHQPINSYANYKHIIEQTHKKIKKNNKLPMLLLKMGYLENYPDFDHIKYTEIIDTIDFWLSNPRISMIEWDNINYKKNFG
jgi:NADP-dependent 3-hydroxy acid dehydrogenase YdfG